MNCKTCGSWCLLHPATQKLLAGIRLYYRLLCLLRCRDGYAALSARLRGLQWDLGRGFETQLQLGPQEVGEGAVPCSVSDMGG